MEDTQQDIIQETKPKKSSAPKKKKTPKKAVSKKKTTEKAVQPEAIVHRVEKKASEAKPAAVKKAITFHEEKKVKKKSSNRSIFLYFFFVIVLLIVAAGFFETQKLSQKTQSETTSIKSELTGQVSDLQERLQTIKNELDTQKAEVAKSDQPKLIDFVQTDLGIKFSFPESLGTAQTQVIDTDPKITTDNYLVITFSANPDIKLVAVTAKNKDVTDPVIFSGSDQPSEKICPTPLEIKAGGYCDIIGKTSEFVEIVQSIKEKDVIVNVLKQAQVNLKNSNYIAVSINAYLGAPPLKTRNLFVPSKDEDSQAQLDDFLRNVIKQDGLSLVVQQNIAAYKQIIDSLEFTR